VSISDDNINIENHKRSIDLKAGIAGPAQIENKAEKLINSNIMVFNIESLFNFILYTSYV
jgi:lipopolysaccharide/colanic/teichoic acid biosynthesis glycosyltransferase